MKKVIFAVTAGVAVAGGSPSFDDLSTSDLEKSTQEFIEMNDITPYRRQRKLDGHMYSTRSERLNGGSKSGKGGKDGKSGKSGSGLMDDDMFDPGSDVSDIISSDIHMCSKLMLLNSNICFRVNITDVQDAPSCMPGSLCELIYKQEL